MQCVVNIYRNDIIQITCNLYLNRFIPQRNLIRWLVLLFFFHWWKNLHRSNFRSEFFAYVSAFYNGENDLIALFAQKANIFTRRDAPIVCGKICTGVYFSKCYFFSTMTKNHVLQTPSLFSISWMRFYTTHELCIPKIYLYNFSKIFFLIIPNTYSWIQSQKNNLNDVFMNWKFSH